MATFGNLGNSIGNSRSRSGNALNMLNTEKFDRSVGGVAIQICDKETSLPEKLYQPAKNKKSNSLSVSEKMTSNS